ncbi:hypothetical protein JAO71_00975 [Olleya sp. YSTF-M6]|uniref:Adenylosuccinate synthetase n=1 Tax=Olleya sediminilitoris TaxID=2795739 RepID=A0ABS1WGV2_9FLAO|nr:hypothetical protein [Olleya sediminilitoris]MBL7558359.1 hypothetical protein [Olleya sediminilitoris]
MLLALLQVNIEEKIKNAPDDNYQIGVLIGSYLPLIALVIIAYLLYRYNKNRNKAQ